MKITFFGHNCYVLQGENVVVLTDPWLTNNGAFFGSWYQWPINHHCKDDLKEQLNTKRNTILYISHEHQDHFDKETLAEIQPLIDLCIIPDYEDKFLSAELLTMGYKIHELRDQTKYSLSQTDYIELMIVDTGVNHDSAAIFKIDEEHFLNQNDCKIFDRLNYLKDVSIDYYAVQFSGATWHPVCYELHEDEKRKISKKKVLSKLVAVRNAINLLKPKFYLPSAGPAIFPFLDKTLSLGIDNIFVHQPDLDNFLKNTDTKLSYLRPGDTLNPLFTTQPIQPPTEQELLTLEKQLDCDFDGVSDQNFEIEQLIIQIENRIEQIQDINFSQCPKLLFDWKEQGLEIDLNDGLVKLINWTYYKFPV